MDRPPLIWSLTTERMTACPPSLQSLLVLKMVLFSTVLLTSASGARACRITDRWRGVLEDVISVLPSPPFSCCDFRKTRGLKEGDSDYLHSVKVGCGSHGFKKCLRLRKQFKNEWISCIKSIKSFIASAVQIDKSRNRRFLVWNFCSNAHWNLIPWIFWGAD